MRRSDDSLIFIMVISIEGKIVFILRRGPASFVSLGAGIDALFAIAMLFCKSVLYSTVL